MKSNFDLFFTFLDYHDPCYGNGVCVPVAQCPSPYRDEGNECYLGHHSVGLCCNAILENPGRCWSIFFVLYAITTYRNNIITEYCPITEGAKFLEREEFPASNGFNDFSRIPNA